jgi:hypothetical protein
MMTRLEYERLRKSAQYYGSVDLTGSTETGSTGRGQDVIVIERQKPVRFPSMEEAAVYLTAVGMLPFEKVLGMLYAREPLINGRQVSYPEAEEA